MDSPYKDALEAAGATVLAFAEFGSYQGDWIARTPNGYISGAYGSCSGCDSFDAEFGWGRVEEFCDDHRWVGKPTEGCAACDEAENDYQDRLAAFGKSYLDGVEDYATLRTRFSEQAEWDYDAKGIIAWLDAQEAIPPLTPEEQETLDALEPALARLQAELTGKAVE